MRVTLSGRNNERDKEPINPNRIVYVGMTDEELGRVTYNYSTRTWQAFDVSGMPHGSFWLTDWYAADALVLGRY